MWKFRRTQVPSLPSSAQPLCSLNYLRAKAFVCTVTIEAWWGQRSRADIPGLKWMSWESPRETLHGVLAMVARKTFSFVCLCVRSSSTPCTVTSLASTLCRQMTSSVSAGASSKSSASLRLSSLLLLPTRMSRYSVQVLLLDTLLLCL